MPYWMAGTVEVDDKTMPRTAGTINCGMLERNPENDLSGTRLVIVVQVSDAEEYCKKIEDAGVKTAVPLRKVGEIGVYARVEDTEGNIIGFWQHLKKGLS